MTLAAAAVRLAESASLPDALARAGVAVLVGRTRRRLARTPDGEEARLLAEMDGLPIAVETDAANAQHYELPPEFFRLFLGPCLKYSCCLYPDAQTTLAAAERLALDATIARADLADGQTILELGCGWGSLSLTIAERFPHARVVAVSNAAAQRGFIERESRRRSLANLAVVTADMNHFTPGRRFDRIVSIEMFEHMANWRRLLEKARGWLEDDGRLFLHVFTHRSRSYRFDAANPDDWIAQHFFTGGLMPAHDLPHRVTPLFSVEDEWRWPGLHYRRTALDWLANFDRNRDDVDAVLRRVYGADAALWRRRWRLFFLATAGLFGHAGGTEWGVGHYRLKPRPVDA
jgi:cyclopropane-fatty-acyl-phospholipid synthase